MTTLLELLFWIPWSIGAFVIVSLSAAFIIEGCLTWLESGEQEAEQRRVDQEAGE